MILALFAILTQLHAAEPYRLVIVTDPETAGRAQEYKNFLLRTPPFSQLGDQLEVVLTQMNDAEMSCANDSPSSPRIINCNRSRLENRRRELDGHHIIAFTNNASGGAGGEMAIASADYPLNTMLHEMLHMYGLADEYCYEGTEVGVYCNPPRRGPNVAMISPEPPYADKSVALSKHSARIPWAAEIAAATPITAGTQTLGTPAGNYRDSAGLFEGGHCSNKQSMAEKVYRPFANSIMRTLSVGNIQPFYQNRILDAMEAATGQRFERRPALVRNAEAGAPHTVLTAPQGQLGPVQTVEAEGVICPPLAEPVQGEDTRNLEQGIDDIYRRLLSPGMN